MKQKPIQTILFFILSLLFQSANAETLIYKAKGEVGYKPVYELFSERAPEGTSEAAVEVALEAAWKKYISSFTDEKRNAYNLISDTLINQRDEFIIGKNIVDEYLDKDNNRLIVLLKVEIDDSAVQNLIFAKTKTGDEKSEYFTWIFVTRAQDSIKNFQDKVVSISKTESADSKSESTSIVESENNIDAQSSNQSSSFKKDSKGGSTLSKRSKVTWTQLSSKEIDAAMNKALVNAGYEFVEYGEVQTEPECGGDSKSIEAIREEFVANTDISSATRKGITKSAKRCDIKYIAIGTLDIMRETQDSVTGLVDVSVSVTAKVYDTSKRFTKTIASVGPVQYSGLGDSEQVARSNALQDAASKAANTIINQMRAR